MTDKSKIVGHLYDIQGYSVHDGPGIRTTVFTKGCPLHCLWCHSPESQTFHDELSFAALKCVGTEKCGLCLEKCPQGAIFKTEPEKSLATGEMQTKIGVDWSKCNGCLKCVSSCPAEALVPTGYDMTVEDTLKRVLKDRDFYGDDGGITISGGECMSQFDFTLELAKESKEAGITVCIDTTGFCDGEKLEALIPYTDLFLYDLKHMDSRMHKNLTGVPNELILENARRIAACGGKMQIRIPTIPKFNADLENIKATAAFCKELGDAVTLVQVLPYHRMGVPKYQKIGRTYKIKNIDPPGDEFMAERLKIFTDAGLPAQLH